MVIVSGIKQLFRTPFKTLFFFVLLILTTAFFTLGFNLWSLADSNMARIESAFITIGTAEQKPESLEIHSRWDAEKKSYRNFSFPVYGERLPISVLDFAGAGYILEPEKRPYYAAYDPGYIIVTDPLREAGFETTCIIVEFQPLEDCETADPVEIRITKVLMGYPTMEGGRELICNHFEEKTYKLYADKTYISYFGSNLSHEGSDYFVEYIPGWAIGSTQCTKDGTRIRDTLEPLAPWDEVTEGFYYTPRGRRWLELIDDIKESYRHTIPVVPTNGTKLLMPFFKGDARINEGRDITEEEFLSGEKVCLVQRRFAEKNRLYVGGSLRLPLIYASYYGSSSFDFGLDGETGGFGGYLNAKGERYTPFEDSEYEIVGIYDVAPADSFNRYALGGNAVIIPSRSVKNSDENNITYVGPMMGYNTSFRIPNGTIDKFMAAWKAQGIDGLEINFYDKGYSKIKAGLDSMKNMAVLLFTVGAATTLIAAMLFCHLFITKQRKRTAIERSLGLSKALCTLSLLAGILVITIPGSIIGSAGGSLLTDYAVEQINTQQSGEAFDTTFSDWVNSADNDMAENMSISAEGTPESWLAGASVIPLSLLIALLMVRGNLKEEPLRLLGEKER